MSVSGNDEGMYPEAHPTAPGGMSMANLRVELAEKHGMSMGDSRGLSWPDLIQAVIDGRQAREAEGVAPIFTTQCELHEMENCADCNGDVAALDRSLSDDLTVEDMFDVIDEEDYETPQMPGPQEPEGYDEEDEFDDLDDLSEYEEEDDGKEGAAIPEVYEHHIVGPFARMAEGRTNPVGDPNDDTVDYDPEDEVFDPESLFEEMAAGWAQTQAENPPIFLGIPGIKDYVFDGHAGAGPSASERWMACTMSLSASREFLETLSPNQQRTYSGANTAARQGTTAHAVSEAKANHMLGRVEDDELSATLLELSVEPEEGEAYDDEMDEYTNEYVDLIKSYADERGADSIRIESRVSAAIPLGGLHEGEVYVVHGSADCIVLPTPDIADLIVADLKYGEGINVEVEENSQARIYALGALDDLTDYDGNLTVEVKTVTLVIAQPRLGGIKVWTETLDDLLDWRDDVLSPALTRALYGAAEGATYEPGEAQCQFCPARGRCPALAEQRMQQAVELFDVVSEAEYVDGPGAFPETGSLSNERLGSLLNQIMGLVDILPDLKEEAQRRLHRGVEIPGRWLVNYTPPRKWKHDPPKTEAEFIKTVGKVKTRDLFTEPKLVTPAQAEKILGPEVFPKIEALIEKPAKRPVMNTTAVDKRKRWEGAPPEAMFDDESTTEDREHAVEEMFPDE